MPRETKLRAFVDRIEDGKTAVIQIQGGGEMFLPVKQFGFPIHEGAHLKILISEDPGSETRTRKRIISLQEKLLKKSRE